MDENTLGWDAIKALKSCDKYIYPTMVFKFLQTSALYTSNKCISRKLLFLSEASGFKQQ